MPLLIVFAVVVVAEIWLFVKVGEVIGAWQTVGLVIAMAFAGAIMVRVQGFTALNRARSALEAGEFPTTALFDGLFVVIAGCLLITPGFLTDFLGGLLFIPPLRRWAGMAIWGWFSRRSTLVMRRSGSTGATAGPIVEGSFHEVRPDDSPTAPVIPPPGNGASKKPPNPSNTSEHR